LIKETDELLTHMIDYVRRIHFITFPHHEMYNRTTDVVA